MRFQRDVSPFAAAHDASLESASALAGLLEHGGPFAQMQGEPVAPPPGVVATLAGDGVQMVAARLEGEAPKADVIALGEADATEMRALAELTKPGPFLARTHTMGRFLGVRVNGRLAAMAGERMQPEGFTEVSAVCTHPDHVGQGYGAALTLAVAERILTEGATPFLHAWETNTRAIALYRRLGFVFRRTVSVVLWERPGAGGPDGSTAPSPPGGRDRGGT
ncbi:MAG: GNAT family N-acetyltransferase [Alphaproteobacteria bacterium]|nr:GNAT family N-acetyltransferase [Alphaproteobacteria bacterium]